MTNEIKDKIGEIINPYTNKRDILTYIANIDYNNNENKVILTLNPFGSDEMLNKSITREIIKLLKINLKILGVKIITNELTNSENFFDNVKVIAITSAKGGVGKSNVAFNIANSLANQNKIVALVDADILGYSISKLANIFEPIEVEENKIIPKKLKNNLEIISTEFFLGDQHNKAVVWRANMFNSLLNKFFKETKFNDNLEYLVIDMPPGTGDTLLNLNNYFEAINSIVVTTPSTDAHYVSSRIVDVLKDLNHNILGVVNNMAYYEIDNKKHYIFGKEDISTYCTNNNIKFLGDIPIQGEEKYFKSDYLQSYYNNLVESLLKSKLD